MTEPLRFALLGLGVGGAYALVAHGIVLVYRGSGVLNFAHGAMAVIGTYAFVDLRDEAGVHWLIAFVLAVALAGAAGASVHLLVMRRLRHASALARVIATLAVLSLVQEGAELRYGGEDRFVGSLLPTGTWTFFDDISIGVDRVVLGALAAAATLVLSFVSRRSRLGLATAAVAENERAAAALGWSPDLIATMNWAFGAAMAAVAGILLVPISGLSVQQLTLIVVPGLAAALVGGFSSFGLTLIGALAIGVAESEAARYVNQPGWAKSIPFAAIIGVLVLRGQSLPLRSQVLDRLPALGTGTIRLHLLAPALIAMTAGLVVMPTTWVDAITTTMLIATVCLSLVVVTGYTGQLSLAQFALAGMGAFVAGRLADVHAIPFPLALLAGLAVAVPVGLVVALPAVRTRGVNLAVATLGLALVIERLVLLNPDYTGGFAGTVVGTPDLLGWDVGSVEHPERYAAVVLWSFTVAAMAVSNLRRGRAGRRLLAVRANERAAASLGISVVSSKLYAFALGSAIAALGGGLMAFRNPNVVFSQFSVLASINVLVLAVIGGIGYVSGSLLGATLAAGAIGTRLTDTLGLSQGVDRYLPLISAGLLLLTILQDPDGLARFHDRLLARLRRAPRADTFLAVTANSATRRRTGQALSVQGLTVRFGGVTALDNLSLVVNPGEVVGLIGPNGAGKTTLIDAVTGFVPLAAGDVILGETSIGTWSPTRRARAGITRTFQSLELFEDMTVGDNLRTAADTRDRRAYMSDLVRPVRLPLPAAAVAAIEEFGLADCLDRVPGELAYGRRRLAGIARAVATDPAVLLLDEPAAGLDDHESAELGELIVRLAREWGLAVLLVEHDVGLIERVCDRVVALDFGVAICGGSPADVLTNPAVVLAYLGAPVDELSRAGVHQDEDLVYGNGSNGATPPDPGLHEACTNPSGVHPFKEGRGGL